MNRTDLHIHTSVSDGTWDVYQLKQQLKNKNINIFSITDHDDINNISNMEDALEKNDNLIFIPGVEVTTTHNDREYHLTLYNYDRNDKNLLELINYNNNLRLNYNEKFVEYMANIYEDVSLEDFYNYKEDRSRGGWKTLNYMIDKKIHNNMYEHFSDISKSGLTITFRNPEDVINLCKKSGGKIFLAHPSYHYRETGMTKDELEFWTEMGIDGVECFSPYNQNEQTKFYIDFCTKNNLMISGGSDCHGDFITQRKLGDPKISLENLSIKQLLK